MTRLEAARTLFLLAVVCAFLGVLAALASNFNTAGMAFTAAAVGGLVAVAVSRSDQ
jgi:hypothetical protein